MSVHLGGQRRALSMCALLVGLACASTIAVTIVGPSNAGPISLLPTEVARKAPECAQLVGAKGATRPTIWEKVKLPALGDHCRSVWSGIERVREDKYRTALDEADRAELATPGQAGPWIVRGSALSRWGRPGLDRASSDAAMSVAAFEKAKAIHPRAMDDAESLEDFGVALLRLGRLDEARRVFRNLLPRSSGTEGLCPAAGDCDRSALAYLTAGMLVMATGETGLDEATAFLREARQRSEPSRELRRVSALALALALDRHGDVSQARDVATDLVKARGVPAEISVEFLSRLPDSAEALAIRAMGLEIADPSAAIAAWMAYLVAVETKTGEPKETKPYAAHARTHLLRLEKGGGGPKTPPKTTKKVP